MIEATDYNSVYLATKAQKLGHLLLQTYLVTVAVKWHHSPQATWEAAEEMGETFIPSTMSVLKSAAELYSYGDRMEKLQSIAHTYDLLIQEETRPVAVALFGQADLVFHLGLDQPLLASPDWYQYPDHPYVNAIQQILDHIVALPDLQRLEFLIASGNDPLTSLKGQLKRQAFPFSSLPGSLCYARELQTIYSFSW